MAHPTPPDRPSPSPVDATLRRALDPSPALARRLVARALVERAPQRGVVLGRPVLVFAVASVVALAFALLAIRTTPTVTPSVFVARADVQSSADSDPWTARAGRQPVRLSISNANGPITITTEAGTAWVLWGDS